MDRSLNTIIRIKMEKDLINADYVPYKINLLSVYFLIS